MILSLPINLPVIMINDRLKCKWGDMLMINLVWNVIYHDVNTDSIELFNIFEHTNFARDLQKQFKKCSTKESLSKALRSLLMYYFWSKCEWEVVVSPWCGSRKNEGIIIDVYWQVLTNWEPFVDYVWYSSNKVETATSGKKKNENIL